VRSYRTPQAVVLELRGRLTVATVSSLESALAGVLTDLDRPLVVDLAELADCVSAGACMLIAAARVTAAVTGATCNSLTLAAPTSDVHRLLAALGVLEPVPAFRTVDAASRNDPGDRLAPLKEADWLCRVQARRAPSADPLRVVCQHIHHTRHSPLAAQQPSPARRRSGGRRRFTPLRQPATYAAVSAQSSYDPILGSTRIAYTYAGPRTSLLISPGPLSGIRSNASRNWLTCRG